MNVTFQCPPLQTGYSLREVECPHCTAERRIRVIALSLLGAIGAVGVGCLVSGVMLIASPLGAMLLTTSLCLAVAALVASAATVLIRRNVAAARAHTPYCRRSGALPFGNGVPYPRRPQPTYVATPSPSLDGVRQPIGTGRGNPFRAAAPQLHSQGIQLVSHPPLSSAQLSGGIPARRVDGCNRYSSPQVGVRQPIGTRSS